MIRYTSQILVLLLLLSCGMSAHAKNMLVNTSQLASIMQEIAKQKPSIVPEYRKYNDIERFEVKGMPGYSMGVRTRIRAQMFGSNGYAQSRVTVHVLPATFYFPDYPDKDPLKAVVQSVDINKNVYEKVLDSAEVKVPIGELNGKKSLWIVYGQVVLKKAKTTLEYQEKNFKITTLMDISKLKEKKAKDYISTFQDKISLLNREMSKMNNVHYEEYAEQEEKALKKERNKLLKQTYTEITDKDVFTSLVGWHLNAGNQMESNDEDALAAWEYKDENSSEEVNFDVEVYNYGNYYKKIAYVSYVEGLSDEQIEEIRAAIEKKLQGKLPAGAESVVVEDSEAYTDLIAVIVKYSLAEAPKGKQVYKNAEKFDKYMEKYYDKLERIAVKAGEKYSN